MTASPWRSLVLTLAAMAVVVLALHVAFPDHPDYAGHFSAGAGTTLGGLSVLLLWHEKPAPGRATALALAAIAVGALTEATIFRPSCGGAHSAGRRSQSSWRSAS